MGRHLDRASWRSPVPWQILGFLIVGLAIASNYAMHHPDEQYYTGGAIAMLRDGDYLTPKDEFGGPRFQKPILAYWLTLASYKAFGVSELSSRLPFLLVGAATLAVTASLARRLTPSTLDPGRRDVAGPIAVAALVAQPLYLLVSSWSMTDILLTFGLTLSALGFARLMLGGRSTSAAFQAYVGAGLAVTSKGMLPLVFIAYVFIFHLIDRRPASRLRNLIHLPAMLLGALIGFGWYGWAIWAHGKGSMGIFVGDQVAQKVAMQWAQPLWLFPAILGTYLFLFSGWYVPALRLRGQESADAPARRVRRMLGIWCVLVAAIFSMAREFEVHYVLPAFPLIAAILGGRLASASAEDRNRVAWPFRFASVGLVVIVSGVAVALHAQFEANLKLTLAAVSVGLAGVLIGRIAVTRGHIEAIVAQGTTWSLLMLLALMLMAPVAVPDQGQQLAGKLREFGLLDNTHVLFVGKFGTSGKLRVCSEGHARHLRLDWPDPARLPGFDAVILPAEDAAKLDPAKYELLPGSSGFRSFSVAGLLKAFAKGKVPPYLDQNRIRFVVARSRAYALARGNAGN